MIPRHFPSARGTPAKAQGASSLGGHREGPSRADQEMARRHTEGQPDQLNATNLIKPEPPCLFPVLRGLAKLPFHDATTPRGLCFHEAASPGPFWRVRRSNLNSHLFELL